MKRISQEDFHIRVVRVIRGRLRLNFFWLRLSCAGFFACFRCQIRQRLARLGESHVAREFDWNAHGALILGQEELRE